MGLDTPSTAISAYVKCWVGSNSALSGAESRTLVISEGDGLQKDET